MTRSRPDEGGEVRDALRDCFWMLNHGGGVGDDAGNEHLAVGQLHVLPHAPLVGVARRGSLDGVGLGLHPEHEVDDVVQAKVA